MEQAELCPGCNLPLDETTVDANRADWHVITRTCAACEHKAALLHNIREEPGASTDGLIVSVVRGR